MYVQMLIAKLVAIGTNKLAQKTYLATGCLRNCRLLTHVDFHYAWLPDCGNKHHL